MAAADPLTALKKASKPQVRNEGQCVAARAVDSLPPKEKAAINAALFDPEHAEQITVSAIFDYLKSKGATVSETSVRLHRRKRCSCVNT